MADTKDKPKAGIDYLPAGEIYEKVLTESREAGDSYEQDPDGYLVRLTNRFAEEYRKVNANPRPDIVDTTGGGLQGQDRD